CGGPSPASATAAPVDVPAGGDAAVAVDDVGARAVPGLDSVDVPAGDHAAVDHGDAAGLDNGPVVGAADEHPAARHGAAGVGGHVHHDGGAGQAHRRCLDARLGALVAGHLRREHHSRFGAVVRVDGDRVGCGGHVHRAGTVKRLSTSTHAGFPFGSNWLGRSTPAPPPAVWWGTGANRSNQIRALVNFDVGGGAI